MLQSRAGSETTLEAGIPLAAFATEAHVLDVPGQRGPGWAHWRKAGKGLNHDLARRQEE